MFFFKNELVKLQISIGKLPLGWLLELEPFPDPWFSWEGDFDQSELGLWETS